ncbi:Amino acid transporter, transmembrane domain [Sesbania bispinosa]|nr:Amino acid transporter, transmembrane domain [Sesbania bispinosa]
MGRWAVAENGDQHTTADVGYTSFFKICMHLVNSLSGIGIVSMPYTLAFGGWLSLLMLFVIAIACCYTGILIKRCMDMDPDIRTFPDLGQCAFGDKGRVMVSIIMNVELYLAVTVAALVILPTVLLEDLSLLSYVSASGVLASSIFILSLFWNATIDGTGFHGKGTLLRWSGMPTSISLYAFCYGSHPILPTLYHSMRNKSQFSSVLFVCFLVCTLGYAVAAVLGYLMFGEEVNLQVTLNLQTSRWSSRVAIYTTLINPITKYALTLTPVLNAIKSNVPCRYNKRLTHILVSTSSLISSLIVAVAIPLFGYLMSLVGALLSISALILVPSVCYLKISGTYKRFGFEMIINYSIIVMGVIVAILGTYRSLKDIIQNL